MSHRLARLALALFLVVLLGGSLAAETPAASRSALSYLRAAAAATPSLPPTGTVAIQPLGGGDVHGRAVVKSFPASHSTLVDMTIFGLPANSVTPWHLETGTCAGVGTAGAVEALDPGRFKQLRANRLGTASAKATFPSSSLLNETWKIVIGEGLACGDLITTPAGFSVVATGLNNPRGLAIGPDGGLYIAEAGSGGNLGCFDGPEGETCVGLTGSISRVLRGQQQRIATGLPSAAAPDGSNAVGPVDISFAGNNGSVIVAGAEFDLLGHLLSLNTSGATGNPIDINAYEAANNPDGAQIDSDPYSVVATADGKAVADAAANDLLWVANDGTISTLAVFPPQFVDAPPFLGLPEGTQIPAESVPTSVVLGPDGAFYVGELTGFPFAPGKARIWRVVPGQAPTVYKTGFTNIIGLQFAPDGSLYVAEITTNGLLSGDPTGALKRIAPNGQVTTIASQGLMMPGGLAVGKDGTVFISNRSTLAGSGQVLSIKPARL